MLRILLVIGLALGSCARGETPAPPNCIPQSESEGDLRLAISSVQSSRKETRIRMVAYAVNTPTSFALPVYLLSRGSWVINDSDRAYLLDTQCREYKLQDRYITPGMVAPPDGVLTLKPGTAFEATLSFPPLHPTARHGVLVYARRVIHFTIPQ